ncbi:T9SS type A sorting domain-containing protein [uncultured Flavobacterium sp.]|uniref:T9SS type A sorting domain-containing protein n=1 Tax=uncultured Flavobacterium sp. TaxID=165435 RepID=UPI00308124DD
MKKLYSLLLFIIFGILSSNAQVVDETFKEPTPYKAAKITVIKELSDGKILLGGNIQFFKEKKVSNLIRLNADYSLDETFVFNGDPKSEIKDVKLQSNGNMIVLTTKDNLGYADYFKLYQLGLNGEIIKEVSDVFNATSIAIQADDKILVTGGAPGYYDFTSCYLKRFNSDFTLDDTFNNNLAFNAATNNVVVSSNGIYVGGTFTAVDGIAKNSLVKLNSDGILDTTFDVGEGTKGQLFSLTLQDDGKLLIGRHFSRIIDTQPINNMCRLNPDGTVDETFNTYYFSFHASTIVVKDSFIYFGMFEPAEFNSYIAKLNPDGTLNQSFTLGRLNENGEMFFTLGIVGDKIIYNNTGNVGNRYGLSVCDFNGNQLDSSSLNAIQYGSFDKGEYFDGKLVVKGDFVRVNDVETFGIALLNENGSVDESFVFPKYIGNVTQFQVIDNTTIFVSAKKKLLKLNNKGEVLKDFDFRYLQLTSVKKFKVLTTGDVLFSDENGLYKVLGEDAFLNYSLKSETYRWFSGVNFEVQDNKIIFTGIYNDYDHYDYKFIRFNLDNTVDETFKINGSGPDTTVNKIKVLDNGEIIAAGDFSNFNGVPVPNQIVKLSKDGELDLQFIENQKTGTIGNGSYHDYRKIEQVGDVIYITEGDANVTAINLDGTFVKNFDMPSVIDNITDLVAVENKEETASKTGRKATLEGSKNNYMFAMGTTKSTTGLSSVIVKVNLGKSSGSLSVGPTPEKLASKVQVFPVPVQEKLNLSFSTTVLPNKISVYSVNGNELYTAKVQSTDNLEVDMSQFSSGIYFVKLFSDSGVITKKIVKK